VIFTSDHGTNFADNLEKVIGKPAGALYPGTMHVPLLIRHPEGKGAGKRYPGLTYTLDVPATVCAVAGTAPKDGLNGKNLLPLLEGGPFASREYLTCRYSNSVWYRDDAPERVRLAQRRILEDAGGNLPQYPLKATDKVKAPFIET